MSFLDPSLQRTANRRPPPDPPLATVLLVGTFAGGGIHHYIDEQRRHLAGRVAFATFDMAAPPNGAGPRWFVAGVLRALWSAIRFPFQRPPDLVHVHTSHRYSFYRAAFYVLYAAHVWRRPVVLHVHGSSFDAFLETRSPALRALQDAVFDASDAIVVLSPYWREVLGRRVDPAKLCVIPNAVDVDAFDPSFGAETPHVVYLSNLIERKGVLDLVAAVDALVEDGVGPFRVSIAGDGPLRGEVAALAARHDRVEALGFVDEAAKRRLLDAGTIYVLPTYAEGLPIAMLEAMAGGNAVVATTVGSIPEVVGPENGRLVEPGDPDALADALAALVRDPETTAAMGRRNRQAVLDRYSWRSVSEALVEVYAEQLSGDGGPPDDHQPPPRGDGKPARNKARSG